MHETTGAEHGHAPPLGMLLASRPQRGPRGAAANTLLGSIAVHALVIAGLAWATMAMGREIAVEEQVTFFELPPEEAPPPPPPPPPVDAPPPVMEVAKGFLTLAVPDVVLPDIPPPQVGVQFSEADYSGMGVEGGRAEGKAGAPAAPTDLEVAPTFTPMTVRPELLNVAEVRRALERSYPPLLRDAGIGGQTVVWFFIDEAGQVVKTQVSRASGYAALDEAALAIARLMKFSPALNRDRKVPVWVEIPIQFTAN